MDTTSDDNLAEEIKKLRVLLIHSRHHLNDMIKQLVLADTCSIDEALSDVDLHNVIVSMGRILRRIETPVVEHLRGQVQSLLNECEDAAHEAAYLKVMELLDQTGEPWEKPNTEKVTIVRL
jgi:hypothetical protein